MPRYTPDGSNMLPSARSSAAYGHACTACAQAKCRCLPSASGGKCQRCNRLNKECVQSTRKRHPKTPSRTAQLEHKVDSLLSLLSASGSMDDTGVRRPIQSEFMQQQIPSPEPIGVRSTSDYDLIAAEPLESSSEIDKLVYEESLLSSFRAKKLPCFPFVHIPETTSVTEFKKESPFLWRCIEVTESRDVVAVGDLTTRLRREISHAVLVELDKTLDLLQAILVYLAWITYESFPLKSSLCMYSQLANGLIIELGLTNPPPGDPEFGTFNQISLGQSQLQSLRPRLSETRTMNERRAVLSFFVLSSMISQYLGRMNPLCWTPHITNCLDALNRSPETPNDAVLVQLTRTRLLAGKLSDGPWNDRVLSDYGFPRAPSSFYLSAFRAELERIRAEIPTELQNNKPILFHLNHTEVSIYEPALLKTTTSEDDLKRLDYLYACLRAVKCFFDLVLSIPSAHFASFPLTHIIQIAHCFVTLFRLSTLDLPGWDRAVVRRTADILDLAHQIAEKWHEVAEIVGNKNKSLHRHAYSGLGAMMHKLKDGWAAKLDPSQNSAPNQSNLNSGEGQVDMDALFGSHESAWLLDAFFSGGIF